MTDNEKLRDFVSSKERYIKAFAEKTKMSHNYLRQVLSGHKPVTPKFLHKIAITYPDVLKYFSIKNMVNDKIESVYKQLSKKELIAMLIEANHILEMMIKK